MGLDGVELVMEIEDYFGISIPDKDAELLHTVGGIHAYLCSRLKGRPVSLEPCASRPTFIRVRNVLQTKLGIDPRRFRPNARVSDVVPLRQLGRHLPELESKLGLRLPTLPIDIRVFLSVSNLVAIAVGFWLGPVVGVVAWFVIALLSVLIVNSGPATTTFAADDTVRRWVRLIHRTNALPDSTSWTDRKIWEAVTFLIGSQLGVDATKLKPETDLITDLGMD